MTTIIEVYENSFISLADATAYLAQRLNADAWDNATDPNKEKALITASRAINKLEFIGDKKVSTQTMEFPRIFGENYGDGLAIPELPQEIKDAVCEEALALLDFGNSAHLKNQKMGISSMNIGAGQANYTPKAYKGILSDEAYELACKWTKGL